MGQRAPSASLQVTQTWEEWLRDPDGSAIHGHLSSLGWQEPDKFQQDAQGPAPLEHQLQAQEGAGGQPAGKQLGRNLSLASPDPGWGALPESQ